MLSKNATCSGEGARTKPAVVASGIGPSPDQSSSPERLAAPWHGEPGDKFVKPLAALFRKYGAFGVTEAFEEQEGNFRRHGFQVIKVDKNAVGDWEQNTAHDDPRIFKVGVDFANEAAIVFLQVFDCLLH